MMASRNPDIPDLLSETLSGGDLPSANVSLALLARAKQGDDLALHELLLRYQERLRRIVRIQLGGSSLRRDYDSMDFVQDTFLAALPKIRELEPRSAASLLHWLAIIATNRLRDAYEHQHAAKRDVRHRQPITHSVTEGIAQLGPGPTDRLGLQELRELLDAEVARLPEEQRRVVMLRDYCGESWARIARELHRRSAAARQLHQRAWIRLRRALRPILADRDHNEEPSNNS